MVITKRKIIANLVKYSASIFLLFLFLTAGSCPGESGGGNTELLLEPTVDGIELYNSTDPWYFGRYDEDYLLVGADDNWPYRPGAFWNDDLYFVSLIRFDQAQISHKNVVQAYLYLYNLTGSDEGSLDKDLQIDRIADSGWTPATVTYADVMDPGFVTPGDTVTVSPPINPGTAYAIDVTDIVKDWAANDANYGFRISSDQVPAEQKRALFISSEFTGEETQKPRLAIEYTE